MFSIKP